MRVEVRSIGPEEAQRLLEGQTRNRRIRRGHVRQMARAMQNGEWCQNGEAIKLDTEGRLRDGQHRLTAIVESGITVEMLVIDGLPPESQETMDMGIRRTMADLLRLRNEANTHLLAATLSVLFRLRAGTLGSQIPGDHPTHQELLRLIDSDPDIRAYVQRGRTVTERVSVSSSVAAALWYEFSRVDPVEADRFFEALKSAEDLHDGDAIFALRRLLERDTKAKAKRSRYQIAGLIIKAWNYWYQGTTVRSLSFRAGGSTPDRFPEIYRATVAGSAAGQSEPGFVGDPLLDSEYGAVDAACSPSPVTPTPASDEMQPADV